MTPYDVAQLIDQSPMNRGMDGASWMATEGNIAATNDAGDVLLFQAQDDNEFEFHWLRMNTKGREAIDYTVQAFDVVFAGTDCKAIYGFVPEARRDSKLMARWIGAKSLGPVPTDYGVCEIFIVTREMREGV